MKRKNRDGFRRALGHTELRSRIILLAAATTVCAQLAMGDSYTWTGSSNAKWGTGGNWNHDSGNAKSSFPNAPGDSATFSGTNTTVDLNSDRTLGAMTFSGTGWQLTNSRTLTLDNSGSAATITVTSGGDAAISPVLAGAANGLTISGGGTVTFAAVNSYAGATTVAGGTLLVNGSISGSAVTVNGTGNATLGGTGTVGGLRVNGGGVVAPGAAGNTPHSLTAGNTTFDSGAVLNIDIANASLAAGTGWDVLNMGTFTQVGTVTVKLSSFKGVGGLAGTPAGLGGGVASHMYDWLIATATTGSVFNTANMTLNPAGFSPIAGLVSGTDNWSWKTDSVGGKSNLYIQYSYNSVPEATTLLLGMAGLAPILVQRRGRRGQVAV